MITLALLYLRIGLIFFGGGYVLIPLLQETLVHHYGWLTQREFIDGLAISQLTPGPLAMLATFTGVRIGGVWGERLLLSVFFCLASYLCYWWGAIMNAYVRLIF